MDLIKVPLSPTSLYRVPPANKSFIHAFYTLPILRRRMKKWGMGPSYISLGPAIENKPVVDILMRVLQ